MKYAIRCVMCSKSFVMKDYEVESEGNMGIYRCPQCNTHYLAYNDKKFVFPQLFKLTKTKSFVVEVVEDQNNDKHQQTESAR